MASVNISLKSPVPKSGASGRAIKACADEERAWSAALDGVRTVFSAGVISFHCLMYWARLMPLSTMFENLQVFSNSSFSRLVWHGMLGSDVFLVLSGYFSARHLLPKFHSVGPPSQTIALSYYRGRILRLLPDYFAVQVAIALAINHNLPIDHPLRDNHDTCMEYCHLSLPLNFMLLSNLVGFGGCGVVFWTVAVQVQLFLFFPLLLALLCHRCGPEKLVQRLRTVLIGGMLLISLGRFLNYSWRGVSLPIPPLGHPGLDHSSVDLVLAYYHGSFGYFSTITRATNFFAGALLATLVMDRTSFARLMYHRRLVVVGTVAAAGVWLTLVAGSHAFMGPPHPEKRQPLGRISSLLMASLGYHGSAGLSLLISTCLLATVFLFPHSAASQLLGLLRPLAPLTFRAYLLHIPLMYWLEAWFLPSGMLRRMVATAPLTSLIIMIVGVWTASFGAALAWQGLDSLRRSLW